MARAVLAALLLAGLVGGCGHGGAAATPTPRRVLAGRRPAPGRSAPARPHGPLRGARAQREGAAPHPGRLDAVVVEALAGPLPAARLLRHVRELDALDRHRRPAAAARRARRHARGRRHRLLLQLAGRAALAGLPPARAAADPRALRRRAAAGDRGAVDGRARRHGLRGAAAADVPGGRVVLRRPAPARRPALLARAVLAVHVRPDATSGATRTATARTGAGTTRRRCCRRSRGSRCSSPPATAGARDARRDRGRGGGGAARSRAARGRSTSRSTPTSTPAAPTTGRTGSASCTARCRCSSARSARALRRRAAPAGGAPARGRAARRSARPAR